MAQQFNLKRMLVVALVSLFGGGAIAQEQGSSDNGLLAKIESLQLQLDKQQRLIHALEESLDKHATAEKIVTNDLKARSPKLECQSVQSLGRSAVCPSGFVATGCAAGMNKGSHSIKDANTCVTDENVDWTTAHCCRTIW